MGFFVMLNSTPQRIGQLLRLALITDKPAEAQAATAALRRTLAAAGLDAYALTAAVEVGLTAPPPPRPEPIADSWRDRARRCLRHPDQLSEKEEQFLLVITNYRGRNPSLRQLSWLEAIDARLF
jgi:hypothetical protein